MPTTLTDHRPLLDRIMDYAVRVVAALSVVAVLGVGALWSRVGDLETADRVQAVERTGAESLRIAEQRHVNETLREIRADVKELLARERTAKP